MKVTKINLILLAMFLIVIFMNISSAMPSEDWSPESHRIWILKNWAYIGITILIAYGAILPVAVFFWKRKYAHEKLRILLKIDWSENGTKHGITALIIGIISICSFWWQVIPRAFSGTHVAGIFFFAFPFFFSLFAVIFCSINKLGNRFIDLGFKLSFIAFVFSIIIFAEIIPLYVS
jgi:hypothetical protein